MIDFGFIVLCPTRDIPALRNSVRRIDFFHPQAGCLAVKPDETNRSETKEMRSICEVVSGKDTYTSLINSGLLAAKKEWNFIVMAGAVVSPFFYRKYMCFLENKKDILFPIVDYQYNFVDGSINGLLLHKDAITEIGQMPEIVGWEEAKIMWAIKAIEEDYKFKAVLGVGIN